jgi:hypothetical protein
MRGHGSAMGNRIDRAWAPPKVEDVNTLTKERQQELNDEDGS